AATRPSQTSTKVPSTRSTTERSARSGCSSAAKLCSAKPSLNSLTPTAPAEVHALNASRRAPCVSGARVRTDASGRAQALRFSCEVFVDAMSPDGLRRSAGELGCDASFARHPPADAWGLGDLTPRPCLRGRGWVRGTSEWVGALKSLA